MNKNEILKNNLRYVMFEIPLIRFARIFMSYIPASIMSFEAQA